MSKAPSARIRSPPRPLRRRARRRADEHAHRGAPGDERPARRLCCDRIQTWDAHRVHLLRELAPQVLGAVIRRFRDFAAAEDAVQEACSRPPTQWPREGLPEQPARLADPRGRAAHDRPPAQRDRTAPARTHGARRTCRPTRRLRLAAARAHVEPDRRPRSCSSCAVIPR